MILAATQPTYLPWLGFFDLMRQADHFVSYDHVQFSKQSWQQRNRICAAEGEVLLTVPVHQSAGQAIADVILAQGNWPRKHLATLRQTYHRAAFGDRLEQLAPIYADPPDRLVDLNHAVIDVGRDVLGVTTPWSRSSELELPTGKNEALIALCRRMGADQYISPAGAMDYLRVADFEAAGIDVTFQDYVHPVYDQGHPGFRSHMAFIDYACHADPAEVPW